MIIYTIETIIKIHQQVKSPLHLCQFQLKLILASIFLEQHHSHHHHLFHLLQKHLLSLDHQDFLSHQLLKHFQPPQYPKLPHFKITTSHLNYLKTHLPSPRVHSKGAILLQFYFLQLIFLCFQKMKSKIISSIKYQFRFLITLIFKSFSSFAF